MESDYPADCSNPGCTTIPGEAALTYWSSSSPDGVDHEDALIGEFFGGGTLDFGLKVNPRAVRGVRGGP